MKEIAVMIDGKKVVGNPLTVADWLALAEYAECYGKENVLTHTEAGLAAIELLANYLKVGADQLQQQCTLEQLFGLWHRLHHNLAAAFMAEAEQLCE